MGVSSDCVLVIGSIYAKKCVEREVSNGEIESGFKMGEERYEDKEGTVEVDVEVVVE